MIAHDRPAQFVTQRSGSISGREHGLDRGANLHAVAVLEREGGHTVDRVTASFELRSHQDHLLRRDEIRQFVSQCIVQRIERFIRAPSRRCQRRRKLRHGCRSRPHHAVGRATLRRNGVGRQERETKTLQFTSAGTVALIRIEVSHEQHATEQQTTDSGDPAGEPIKSFEAKRHHETALDTKRLRQQT